MSKYKADSVFQSINYAIKGILLATKSQRNFRIDLFIAMIVIIAGVFLSFSMIEFCILLLTIGFVFLAELLNTIVEFIIDAYFGNKYSTLAKMSKDISAGMVLISVILAVIIGGLLFLPKLITLF